MAIKDFFRSSQIIASATLNTLGKDAESAGYISPYLEDQERLEPHIDFGNPANFAKYGSAQEYYDQSIRWVYGEYPYDGSLKERLEWRNKSTLLDLYIYDNRYPKSTGYGILSSDTGDGVGWGTMTGSVVDGYGAPTIDSAAGNEYINFKGGPNSPYGASLGTSSLHNVFNSRANVWDADVTGSGTRESNLKTDLDVGVTVEFWFKTGSTNGAIFPVALTHKQVVFDLWNNQASGSADHGRFRIELDGRAGSAAVSATATVTITAYTELNPGDKVNLVAADGTNYDFVQGDQSSVNGTFEATTSNDQTATNLMNVINTSSGPAGTRFTATVDGAVVTITQATAGDTGNTTITLTDSGTAGMTKTDFTGGLSNSAAAPFRVTLLSGSAGLSTSSLDIGSSLNLSSFSDWKHYALSFINNGTNITTKLYVNGDLNETITTGSNIGVLDQRTSPLQANIGALLTSSWLGTRYATPAPTLGWGKLSGSIDEFRFWKAKRSSKDIGRYWFTSNIGGGTNTDFANTALGVYYKFNEGITTDTAIDNTVLDYSGRVTNGAWTGYTSASRNTGSAIVSASAGYEDLDPIIRPQHTDIYNLDTELAFSGSLWDYENNSSMYYTMPSWIIDEDEGNGEKGDLKKLTQIMGSYFDNLQLQIGELSKINFATYPSSSAHGKLFKPYAYASRAIQSHGLEAPELFSNINLFEYFANRNEDKEYDDDIQTIKNFIYNNIYNNLASIYKAKGTEKSFRNLIRCFGIDEDLIRINAYADNQVYKLDTKRRATSYKTKAVDFNHIDRSTSTVYQYPDSSNTNSVSYISGSAAESKSYEDSFPVTVEAEIVFPLKLDFNSKNKWRQDFNHTTSSLFGMHTAIVSASMDGTETDLTWDTPDAANFQVFAIRDEKHSPDVYFKLTASAGGMILGDIDKNNGITSSYFTDVYNDSKWNFAVRVVPRGYPHSFVSGATDNTYNIEFYGVNYIADRKINEFEVKKTVTTTRAEAFLTSSKRTYVGAHHTNFSGTIQQYSDTKITSFRYWLDYLNNDTIQYHAIDPGNFGHSRPYRDAYLLQSDLTNVRVPNIEALALYWDFDAVTGSDASGQFLVQDVSSGSIADAKRYDWLGKILKYQHTGRGDSFPASSTGSVETQYLYAGRQQLPEIVQGDDNIRVLSRAETEVFTKDTQPTKTYYAFEKSMYQIISDEMLNYFGSIAEFNNLIGEPVNRYRSEYKGLKYLRQFFFERVRNEPDLDKFVDYYKWLDSTLETMLMQLVPASAQVSDGIDNVVESHILERNKYWNKFPTLEFNVATPETGVLGINKLLYSWPRNHRPLSGLQSDNCEWWQGRAERDTSPLNEMSGGIVPAGTTADRKLILTASTQILERDWTTPYRYTVEKTPVIHGGVNYPEHKRPHFYRGMTFPHGPKDSLFVPQNVIVTFYADVQQLEDCDDEITPNIKKKYAFGTHIGRTTAPGERYDDVKGNIAMPFNLISASEGGLDGYNADIQYRFLSSSQLVNLHNDGYGDLNEVPMQGPFTEQYVGGHQGRHVRLNRVGIVTSGSAISATATVTITAYTELNAGDKVNLVAADGTNYDFTQGDQSSVNGTFEATVSNEQTATNLMNVINTTSGPSGTRFTATVDGAVVTITQATAGDDGNTAITLTDAGTAGMTKTDFTGGLDDFRVGGDGNPTLNNLDNMYSRPEAYRLLVGGGPPFPWGEHGLGAIGITGPDYGGPYPDTTRYRAWWFREETAKRPVNIRNILQTTASVDTVLSGVLQHGPIGNYEKTYQIVQTSGRSTNNFWFNDNGVTLPPKYITNNPKTTNVHTLVAVRPAFYDPEGDTTTKLSLGNCLMAGLYQVGGGPAPGKPPYPTIHSIGNFIKKSNLYHPKAANSPLDAVLTSGTVFTLPSRTKQDAVIVERFSAPGGPEVNSLGFLDIMAAEKSVYNALPWRNLMVRGSGSGELGMDFTTEGGRYQTSGTMRVQDQLGHRRGLRTLLSLHAKPFGGDGTYGLAGATATVTFTGVPTNNQTITIISADGTSKAYIKKSSENLTTDPPQFHGATAGAVATSLKACIGAAAGHAGKIGVSDNTDVRPLLASATLTLTQVALGTAGNTTITEDLSNATKTNFTGGEDGYETAPSFHKVNRNARWRIKTGQNSDFDSLNQYATGVVYDNWHVQHSIPQNDFQYSWINSSFLSGSTPIGHAPRSGMMSSSTGLINAIAILSSSALDYSGAAHQNPGSHAIGGTMPSGTAVDFVGLNTLIYDPMGGSRHDDPIALPASTGFNKLSSSIPFPSAGGNPAGGDIGFRTPADLLAYRNNGFGGNAGPVPMLGSDTVAGATSAIFGYLATASFNALMLHRNGPYGWCSWRQVRGGNHPCVRAMRAHNTYGIIDPESTAGGGQQPVMGNYKRNSDYQWGQNIPNQEIFRIGAGNRTRDREVVEFYEPAVILRDHGEGALTFNVALNVENATVAGTNCSADSGPPAFSIVHAVIKSSYVNQKEVFSNSKFNGKLRVNNPNSNFGSCTSTAAGNIMRDLKTRVIDADILNIKYCDTIWPTQVNSGRTYVRGRTTWKEFWRDSRKFRNEELTDVVQSNVDPDNANSTPYNQSIWPLDARLGIFSIGPNPGIKVAYDVFVGGKGGPSGGDRTDPFNINGAGNEGRLQNSTTFIHTGYHTQDAETAAYCTIAPAGADGGRSDGMPWMITASATYSRRHTNLTGTAVFSRSSFLNPGRDVVNRWVVPFAGDAPWDAGRQSGKNPFYDSYADYVRDMSLQGKDYSILPEYRMSERMESYIVDRTDPFNDTALFSLTGSKFATTTSDDTDFYKIYMLSDFKKNFGVVSNDVHTELGAVANELSVTCKGLLKLLPYDGFYPASRTLQLADLFSSSYSDNVFLTGTANNLAFDPTPSYWRSFLTPWFAPGLMFNTIKSGIAVDFPIFTASCPMTGSPIPTGEGDTGTAIWGNFFITNNTVDYRVPFEALVEPDMMANINIYDMECHPSGSFTGSLFGDFTGSEGVRANWNGVGDKRYKLAMHNFLAETPEFFLDNGTFTSFFSAPRSKWKAPDRTKSYQMRIKVRKSYTQPTDKSLITVAIPGVHQADIHPQIITGSETICMYSRPSAFGPPSLGCPVGTEDIVESQRGFGGGSEAGYNAPFTPCYYDGAAWLTLEYNPILYADTELPELDVLLTRLTASHLRYSGWADLGSGEVPFAGLQNGQDNQINFNANQVTSSINAFGTTKGLADLLKYDGYSGADEDQWVIQTKFETPILNFINTADATGVSLTSMSDNYAASACSGGMRSRPHGMWHQYGRLPTGDEGIFLEISDIPNPAPASNNFGAQAGWKATGSLANLVGFAKESVRLGRPALTKTIREAVVAVPFIEQDNERKFFTLPKDQIEAAAAAEEGSEVQGVRQSVKQMVDAIPKYVFPPSFDFVKYPHKVTPISMYIFEFEHELNQQDLVDIWQNLPPRIGRAFDEDSPLRENEVVQTKEISHILQTDELCSCWEDTMQFMVFKVKQRANTNYWKKTVENNSEVLQSALAQTIPTSMTAPAPGLVGPFAARPKVIKPATRFTAIDMSNIVAQGAGAGAVLKTGDFRRSYNWPYDFFSLVELAKIDECATFVSPEDRAAGVTPIEKLSDLTKLAASAPGPLRQQSTTGTPPRVVSARTKSTQILQTRKTRSKGREKNKK